MTKVGSTKEVRQGYRFTNHILQFSTIYMEEAIKEFLAVEIVKINGILYKTIHFVDDITLIAVSEKGLKIFAKEILLFF